ncbi:MAG: TadE/TadG family type IV pilus assembly protein [Eggerthellaceae bacterium]
MAFVIALPLLLLFLFAVVDLGRSVFLSMALDDAAHAVCGRHRVILRAMSRDHSCARRLSLRRRRSTATICIWASRFAMASSRIALTSIGSTARGRMRTTNERRSPDRGRSRSRSCSRARTSRRSARGCRAEARIRSVRVPRPGSRRADATVEGGAW